MPAWTTPIGDHLTRRERGSRYGGALYGGIEPSASSPNVFIYSDPSAGDEFGYQYDGWTPDGELFLYTGDGQSGDQQMIDGNKAILEAARQGRSLRLFVADGTRGAGATKDHLYVGEFALDSKPFDRKKSKGKDGQMREVYVFRLRPLGQTYLREDDLSPFALTELPDAGDVEVVGLEAHNAPSFDRAGSEAVGATRTESDLVSRYVAHLQRQGHSLSRRSIRPAHAKYRVVTDIFDDTDGELYEAKGSSHREAVRMALGQLLDYGRYVRPTHTSVLLPSRPDTDLVDLLREHDIDCVYEVVQGRFERAGL